MELLHQLRGVLALDFHWRGEGLVQLDRIVDVFEDHATEIKFQGIDVG